LKPRAPEYVLSALRRLEARGFEGYLVGGCVRDMIMGRRPRDWDICTDALSEEVMQIFPHSHPTGIAHGTVTVISRGQALEITTYRTDGEYSDFRRPDKVSFGKELETDLSRRDFTINAMAMSAEGLIRDPFGGKSDIEAQIIRTVGKPDERFSEDSLRMLRALRFSAVLGFEIETETLAAVHKNSQLISHVAIERISSELLKTLLAPNPEAALSMLEISLLCGASGLQNDKRLKRLRRIPKQPAQRLAALAALLASAGVVRTPRGLLTRLRLDSASFKNASLGAELALTKKPETALDWKRLLAANGKEVCDCLAAADRLLSGNRSSLVYRQVLSSGECCSLKNLAISGGDLLKLGFSGRDVGTTLNSLLDHVLQYPQENNAEKLSKIAKKLRRS